ncbi:MAG: SCO family protein [Magnetococcales bacterium]|nr:SCO family protein [Magnetococcales bacterium]NGZ26036.1 SCO family protein [Magnetococcales bacterium]
MGTSLLPVILVLLAWFASPSFAEEGYDFRQLLDISQKAIGNKVSNHPLVDGRGQRLKLEQFRGKPLVISLIYTSCYQICSMATRNLAEGVEKARLALGNDAFNVITIGFDTPRDTPQSLSQFARQQGIHNLPGWTVAAAQEETVALLIQELGFRYFASPKGYDHMVQATILDSEGVIYRQVYGESFDLPLLVEPLKELVLGRPQPNEALLEGLNRRVRLFCTTFDPNSNSYRFDYSIFIGMFIGGSILLIVSFLLWREFRRAKLLAKQNPKITTS